ncbi:hypothetical protein B9Z19DRAFT_1068274 [Tuber borchii]|uniref:Uncharacterized protein n=1 Tax=Tuber borchii TaxID=42251 RepID=A0A2T6ZFS6_TUBBO|nr:hypothetical protein B9Z19DRAFT_1068274 [Tuber borchii]
MANIQEETQAPNRQPNWEIIWQSLRNITDETALIPNVPAFNQGDFLQPLDQIIKDVAALQREQDTIKQRQDAYDNQVAGLLGAIGDLRGEICRQEKHSIARVLNSSAIRYSSTLRPFYGGNGELVPGFPKTLGAAKRLLRPDITRLLSALDLSTDGLMPKVKTRFFEFIGVIHEG